MSRVLIVDDHASSRATVEAHLVAFNFDLAFACDGDQALAVLETTAFDLVICDAMMPGRDGFSVCRAAKQDVRWKHIPILLVTALDEQDDLIRALEAGADDFLNKPVQGAMLRAKVQALLRVRTRYMELGQQPRSGATSSHRDQLIAAALLTAREREVLELLLMGREHDDVATVLGITPRTSKFHHANLLRKLGADSRLDLLRLFT